MAKQPLYLFNFGEGQIKFRIKIPATVTFKIGVIDSWSNQYYVTFPANTTRYGLVRNSEWGQASIPVSDLRGTAIDLHLLSYAFVILEEQGTGCEFAIDDICYDGGAVIGVGDFGVAPRTAARLAGVPNPFRASTELRFELAAAGPYEIAVYDAAGQRVTGFRGIGRSGPNAVRLDGRDDRGSRASAGVYYFRLVSGGRSASGQVLLTK